MRKFPSNESLREKLRFPFDSNGHFPPPPPPLPHQSYLVHFVPFSWPRNASRYQTRRERTDWGKAGDNHGGGRRVDNEWNEFPRREWPLNRREESSVTDTRIVLKGLGKRRFEEGKKRGGCLGGNSRKYKILVGFISLIEYGWFLFLKKTWFSWLRSSRWGSFVSLEILLYATERFWFFFFRRENLGLLYAIERFWFFFLEERILVCCSKFYIYIRREISDYNINLFFR